LHSRLRRKPIAAGVKPVDKYTKFWLIVIFLLAGAARFVDLGTHFAHYDDITVATDILKTREPYFEEQLLRAIYDTQSKSYANNSKVFLRNIYENHPWLYRTGISASQFLIVTAASNGAPLQFLLTPLLIHEQQSYRGILFWSRLPSCVFSICAVWLIYLILKKRTNAAGALLGALTAALAIESIIYAKQPYTYALGCLAAAGLLLLYQHSRTANFWPKHWLASGLLTSLSVYAHYQSMFFLPAYYLANLWQQVRARQPLKHLIFSGLVNLFGCLPILFLLFCVSDSGTSGVAVYTLGRQGEFLFSPSGKSFLYPLIFGLKNSFIVLAHTLAPVTADRPVFWLFGLLFALVFLRGLKNTAKQPEGLFIFLSLLTYLGLVFWQKLALTPTRQALVYLPLFIYICAQGLPDFKKSGLTALLLAYAGIFLFFFPAVVRERRDPLNEQELSGVIRQFAPDLIAGYDFTPHAALWREVRDNHNYLDQDNLFQRGAVNQYNTLIFLGTRHELDAQHFQKIQSVWNARSSGNARWDTAYSQYETVYQKIITSNIELEPNNWNSNGTNNLFFYVLALK
jgi:hypothetical protein